jgi:hypothetical protein
MLNKLLFIEYKHQADHVEKIDKYQERSHKFFLKKIIEFQNLINRI